ncbi:MAG: hypothetical protein AAFR90_07560 [Pseudomonadota bacterium]
MAQDNGERVISNKKFGRCCKELAGILEADEFEPLIRVWADNGILFMTVGFGEADEYESDEHVEAVLTIDHPVFYCPFCGTKLQDPESIEAQLSSEGELIQ